jgi:hypothetical protein
LLLDLTKQSGGVVAKSLALRFPRPVPAAWPDDDVDRPRSTLIDPAAPNSLGGVGVAAGAAFGERHVMACAPKRASAVPKKRLKAADHGHVKQGVARFKSAAG